MAQTRVAEALRDDEWRARLKAELPREEIPAFLTDLQRLVAGLREYRDDLKVPSVEEVIPLLSPRLNAHAELTLGYLDDARYATVVRAALQTSS
jgi:hypothetical protein